MHLGNPHFSLWEIAQEIFVAIVVTFKNLFTLGTCFQVFYSISILWLYMANNAQSLVNYLEKIVMATNSSGLTWIQPICQCKSKGKEKEEKGREQELTGDELAQILCSIWWQIFVSSYYVLTVFLHWNYKMKYSCYQLRFFCYPWLAFYLIFGWEMCCLTKSSCKSLLSKKYIYIHFNTASSHCKFGTWQNSEVAGWADRWFWKVN